MATVMQEPFPVLTHLGISLHCGDAPVLPGGFLGGSAPCLRDVYIHAIPFPALPTLLLSTSGLVTLTLSDIPPSGYFSPAAMVVGLAALTKLKTLTIEFDMPDSDLIQLPPVTRIVLPALTSFTFKGTGEYLEDLVAHIDGPRLDQTHIYYLQLGDVPVAQLSKFVDRSVVLKSTLFRYARISFFSGAFDFTIYHRANQLSSYQHRAWAIISCESIDLESNIAMVLSQFSAPLSNVVHLKLKVTREEDYGIEGTEDVEWLHLFRQFPAVQTLYVSWELAGHVALALEDVAAEMVAKVLPSLNWICLRDQPASSLEKFVSARRLSGRPVTFVDDVY
jgi:hypothetical protein